MSNEYVVNQNNVIISSGKFAGCPCYAPSFYARASDGEVLATYDVDNCFAALVPIREEDVDAYPELEGCSYVCVLESDDGDMLVDAVHSSHDIESIRAIWARDNKESLA